MLAALNLLPSTAHLAERLQTFTTAKVPIRVAALIFVRGPTSKNGAIALFCDRHLRSASNESTLREV
jgi:hypothetical protein